jgi:hypothetical protein
LHPIQKQSRRARFSNTCDVQQDERRENHALDFVLILMGAGSIVYREVTDELATIRSL